MPDVQTVLVARGRRTSTARALGRWMLTFLGFPLGGVGPWLLIGPVDGPSPALLGGLVTGAVIGAVQAWGLGRTGPFLLRWSAATAAGLMVGLGIGAAIADYDTTMGALVVQGACSGLAVGAAQSVLLRAQLGRLALAWPPFLGAVWAVGWAVTTSAGVGVDEQFTVFGSTGALVVTLLTAALPLAVRRREQVAS